MDFSDAELAALDADTQAVGYFFRLETDPIVQLWAGAGPIKPGINAIDLTGATYQGFGELSDIPTFQQLINGAAEQLDFVLSGASITSSIVALAASQTSVVRQKACNLGIGIMGPDWKLLGPVHWTFTGVAAFLRTIKKGASNENDQTSRQIVLSVGSLFTGRRRRGLSYWTDPDQQALSPGDRFCERTVKYAEDIWKVWPPAS
jgi:hypothetical protein